MSALKDIFSKHEEPSPTVETKPGVPTQRVITLRGQGLSNNQIFEALQREGYSVDQISDAINQADIKEGVETIPFKQGDTMQEQAPYPGMPAQQAAPSMPAAAPIPAPSISARDLNEQIQEVAESIIEEKWSDLIDNVNKIMEWKDSVEERIREMETSLKDLKDSFDKLHQGVLERVGEYDKSIRDVGTEIKALEKVFQKILPGFVENVSELSRITEGMKKAAKKK